MSRAAQLAELRKILARLYPLERDQVRLATESNLTVGAIAFGGSAFNNWHAVLHHAEQNRRIDALLGCVQEEFEDNEDLAHWRSGSSGSLPEGREVPWQGPRNARGLLEKMTAAGSTLVSVSHLELGLLRAKAVAKVVIGSGGTGTGFVIEGNRLVTNHHVLPDRESARDSHVLFNYQHSAGGAAQQSTRLSLQPEQFFLSDSENDFTVVGLQGEPSRLFGSIPLTDVAVRKGDVVNIIQHCGGGPKQMGLSFDAVAYADEGRVQYLTSTLPGSSGAPVFDRHWNVVAVHHSGGWVQEPGCPEGRVYYRNQGVAIARVRASLAARGALA